MEEEGASMGRDTSRVGHFSINTYALNVQLLYPPPLPNMRPCSAVIGRISCPCEGYVAGTNKGVCDACAHSFEKHFQSPAIPSPSLSSVVRPTPGRAKSVTTLFNQLLKSTSGGATALQETSNGLRKTRGVSILAQSHSATN